MIVQATETGNSEYSDEVEDVREPPMMWSDRVLAYDMGIIPPSEDVEDVDYPPLSESDRHTIYHRAWLLMPTARRVLGTAQALHTDAQNSVRVGVRPIVPVRTAAILEDAVHRALETAMPWTQAQLDDTLRALADPKDVAAADLTPLGDMRLGVS